MGKKRKHNAEVTIVKAKHQKTSHDGKIGGQHVALKDNIGLSLYYQSVLTLKQFLLARLPAKSRIRRKRVTSFRGKSEDQPELGDFLDSTLIGVMREPSPELQQARRGEFSTFTQSQYSGAQTSGRSASFCIEEVRLNQKALSFFLPVMTDDLYRSLTLPYGFFSIRRTARRTDHIICFVMAYRRQALPWKTTRGNCTCQALFFNIPTETSTR